MSSPRPYEQDYFPPMQQDRRRSSSAADRYRPRTYSSPPPHQPDPYLLGPHQQQFSSHGTPVHANPPYPEDMMPQASPRINMPLAPRRSSAQDVQFRRDDQNLYQDALTADMNYRRDASQEAPRRPSYSGSTHGRRASHDSRRSHHSHHSHRSSRHEDRRRRDDDDDYDDELDEDRRHSHHDHHHDHDHNHNHNHRLHSEASDLAAYRQRQKDKGENVSRSLGDSLMSVLYPLKYLFEPRDKY